MIAPWTLTADWPWMVTLAPFKVSAQVHRVNVSDGHMAAVRVKLARQASLEELREAFSSFTSLPQELRLHTAPERPIIVREILGNRPA